MALDNFNSPSTLIHQDVADIEVRAPGLMTAVLSKMTWAVKTLQELSW